MPKIRDCPSFSTFGKDVKAARCALKMPRRVLAEKVHIEPRYLATIENEGKIPSVPVLYDLILYCHLSPERYFGSALSNNHSELRQSAIDKLAYCPEALLPIIDSTINGAIRVSETLNMKTSEDG